MLRNKHPFIKPSGNRLMKNPGELIEARRSLKAIVKNENNTYQTVFVLGWLDRGRERGRNYNKAGSSSSSSNSSETMCAVLYSEYAYDVLMIDSLEPGCLWVWDKPWQPEQLAGLLLPEHCLDILAMPRGSLSKAMARRFRYVCVPRMHLHDAPGYRSRLTFVFKELDVKAGNVCRTESLNGALVIDMLMQAAGQPPANFDRAEQRAQALDVIGMSLPELVESQAGRMRGCPNKQQHFLEVLLVAGASGRIPELQGWAALRAPPSGLDAGRKPSRAGSKRKLGDLDALSAKAQETGVVSWSCQEREQHLPDGVRLRVAGPWPRTRPQLQQGRQQQQQQQRDHVRCPLQRICL
ncbi:hypothetical protein COO60DRAFT_1702764 [Scenedesmus sp. NREL 46B-D3]|nr:hypothetical protein COO60DRAFT_1702764 [Scenedesmus sp. NREL 46B-D3]